MAYENGLRINRYEAKMKGKIRDRIRHKKRCTNKWWRNFYSSKHRQYYFRETNRKIRCNKDFSANYAIYRKLISSYHYD